MRTLYQCEGERCSFQSYDRDLVVEHERITLHRPCPVCYTSIYTRGALQAHLIETHGQWATLVVKSFVFWLSYQPYADVQVHVDAFVKALKNGEVPEWN